MKVASGRVCASLFVLLAALPAAAAQDKPPMVIAKQGNFFVGGHYETSLPDNPWVGQMYVQYQIPAEVTAPYPIVLVHGGSQTGQRFWETPDGREGWAQFFLRRGYPVYVVDQVGRGRSAYAYDYYGDMTRQSLQFVLRRATGTEDGRNWLWPQAHLHTQGVGEPKPGDPVFDHYFAGTVSSMGNPIMQRLLNIRALGALLDKIGPAVVLVHSQSGGYGFPLVQERPNLVKALVAIEPSGPPVHDVILKGPPDYFDDDSHLKPWGLTDTPMQYEPAVTDPSQLTFVKQERAEAPGLAPCWLQGAPVRRLVNMDDTPILIMDGEASFYAPYNHCTVRYLEQAGVDPTHIALGEIGIRGNGHSMMLERNSDQIAGVIADWLDQHVP